MVALWMPNAASESLEKKKFVSICLGHRGPEHPKRASHGRTLGAKRRLWPRPRKRHLGHPGPEHLVPPRLFPI